MPSVKRKLQANALKATRFNFNRIAASYDNWYVSRRGAMYDRLEKKLIANFLPAETEGKKLLEI
jgi:hypothetical protein